MNELIETSGLQETMKYEDPSQAIVTYRAFLFQEVPCRIRQCPLRIMTCCGQCVRQCHSRCLQDSLQRAFLYMYGYDTTEQTGKYLLDAAQRNPDYDLLVQYVTDYMQVQHKYGIKKWLKDEPLWVQWKENTHKFNYACQTTVKIDPGTRIYLLQHWPQTGLCPFCIPPSKKAAGRRSNRDQRGI